MSNHQLKGEMQRERKERECKRQQVRWNLGNGELKLNEENAWTKNGKRLTQKIAGNCQSNPGDDAGQGTGGGLGCTEVARQVGAGGAVQLWYCSGGSRRPTCLNDNNELKHLPIASIGWQLPPLWPLSWGWQCKQTTRAAAAEGATAKRNNNKPPTRTHTSMWHPPSLGSEVINLCTLDIDVVRPSVRPSSVRRPSPWPKTRQLPKTATTLQCVCVPCLPYLRYPLESLS